MASFDIAEFDVFFISYDEPNAEKHYADLLAKCPWARRVHGIKGFDAAHRACGEQAETDWFITVDGDATVLDGFFKQRVELANPRQCLSWNGLNMMNGLQYGNGGLKLWSREFVAAMNTHERADDPRKEVDFCWETDYQQIQQTYSEVWPNGSPYQAFRVGYREAVKLSLNRGQVVPPECLQATIAATNLRNLRVWCSVGSHIENGLWALYGTRLGLTMMIKGGDFTRIRDYDWFAKYWQQVALPFEAVPIEDCRSKLMAAAVELGGYIEQRTAISVPLLAEPESAFFCDTFKYRNE